MFAQIVEPRVAAHEKTPVLERFDVKIGVAQRRGIADNFFRNVVERDDPFRAAEFIDDNGEPLGVGEKTAEQIHRFHRFRDIRRRAHQLGVMLGRIEQEQFHVEHADDLVRRIGVDGDAMVAALAQLRDRLFVRQVVGQRERIHSGRHAILSGLVAELDDFLDHLGFRLLQRPFFFADFNQGLEFFIGQMRASTNVPGRDQLDYGNTDCFQGATDGFEQWD